MNLVEQWLEYLTRERGRAANTVSTYARTLRTLPSADNATRDEVEAWWRQRADHQPPLSPSTRNNELSAVREFYRWCQRFDHRTDDPTIRIDQLKKPHRESRFVGRTDLARLLEVLPDDLRRAVALGAYGGLRVSEAADLDWRSVDIDSRRIIVRGKGDKERRVGLTATLLDHILPNTGGNVVTAGGRPYSGHRLQMKINPAFRAADVDATFHKLRHRYGYKAAEAGIAPSSIARAMGHASLSTTMAYIAAVDSDLDMIAEAVTR